MMASPPARLLVPPAGLPAPTVRARWCSQPRLDPHGRPRACAVTPMPWCAWRFPGCSSPSASGMRTSPRRLTSRSSICSVVLPPGPRVFDISLLASRLAAATDWLRGQPSAAGARIGYFGASTGAAAALWVAAEPSAEIGAIVSRGGRPDLAGSRLASVRAPTLLIVGGNDEPVLGLNREAQRRLRCHNRLQVVAGATHLFEEPGALENVARLASDWFTEHLRH